MLLTYRFNFGYHDYTHLSVRVGTESAQDWNCTVVPGGNSKWQMSFVLEWFWRGNQSFEFIFEDDSIMSLRLRENNGFYNLSQGIHIPRWLDNWSTLRCALSVRTNRCALSVPTLICKHFPGSRGKLCAAACQRFHVVWIREDLWNFEKPLIKELDFGGPRCKLRKMGGKNIFIDRCKCQMSKHSWMRRRRVKKHRATHPISEVFRARLCSALELSFDCLRTADTQSAL